MSIADIDRMALEAVRSRPIIMAKFVSNAVNSLLGTNDASNAQGAAEADTTNAINQINKATPEYVSNYLNAAKQLGADPAIQSGQLATYGGGGTLASVPSSPATGGANASQMPAATSGNGSLVNTATAARQGAVPVSGAPVAMTPPSVTNGPPGGTYPGGTAPAGGVPAAYAQYLQQMQNGQEPAGVAAPAAGPNPYESGAPVAARFTTTASGAK